MSGNGHYPTRLAARVPPGLVPIVLGEGTPEELGDLEILNTLYEEGDLGELQLFLQNVDEDERENVEQAVDELEAQLQEEGALPWPGATRIAVLEWRKRTVIMRFQQGAAFLLVLGAILIRLALALSRLLPASALLFLARYGLPVTAVALRTLSGTVAFLFGISIFGFSWLRRFLPLSLLIGGGLLIFTLLRPDLAWRALKWVGEQALGLLDKLGLRLPELAVAAAAGIYGTVMLTIGMKRAFR